MAYSAVLFGYGSGSILFDIIQSVYINPENHSPDKSFSPVYPEEKYFSRAHIEILERVPNAFLYLSVLYFMIQLVGVAIMFEYNPNESSHEELASLLNNTNASDASISQRKAEEENEINSLGIRYHMLNEGMELKDALQHRTFYLILSIMTLAMVAPRTVITNYKVSFSTEYTFLSLYAT
jgi:hypothetical protein